MQRIQAAASAAERAALERELQDSQKGSNRELQEKMTAIQAKYQQRPN